MQSFSERLKAEILKGLPGTEIQWQMSSLNRLTNKFPLSPGEDTRLAAVLILLYPHHGSINTLFMQRPVYDGIHGGQISFPGGKTEPFDKTAVETALRETYEETGTDPKKITVIGSLTPLFIPVSNMLVTPVVGWINKKPRFRHQPEEVQFLFDAELQRFLDPEIVKTKFIEVRGEMLNVRYFDYDGNNIWGATAMILQELLVIIRRGALFPM